MKADHEGEIEGPPELEGPPAAGEAAGSGHTAGESGSENDLGSGACDHDASEFVADFVDRLNRLVEDHVDGKGRPQSRVSAGLGTPSLASKESLAFLRVLEALVTQAGTGNRHSCVNGEFDYGPLAHGDNEPVAPEYRLLEDGHTRWQEAFPLTSALGHAYSVFLFHQVDQVGPLLWQSFEVINEHGLLPYSTPREAAAFLVNAWVAAGSPPGLNIPTEPIRDTVLDLGATIKAWRERHFPRLNLQTGD